MVTHTFESSIGHITVSTGESGLTSLTIGHAPLSRGPADNAVVLAAKTQISEFLAGSRQSFDLPFSLLGTPFQLEVWRALQDISYGHTLSYGELAEKIGRPGSGRAVGGAVGANPLPIIIPCHRVMGSSGAITGYSGGDGIPTKRALLDIEGIG